MRGYKPPLMPKEVGVSCKHNYKFLRSEYDKRPGQAIPGENFYRQIDVFYCTKCLEYEKVIARTANRRSKPSWYKG